ncbi:hypothetical protein N5J53_08840 [Empedobacter sp. GD03644]|uniref:hypothetical protein n=1 Tax=Empedobacter sp. GD03644 TaxID=2975358 RepID=UPI002447DDF8|nr:hypothetical protein [Empedobacter sp. GD03644]MDH2207100.1 hypothetical protein [Empedobacter sp. GD03644]
MKKKLTSLTILLFNTAVFSQVGINTDNPKSTLDISVKNTGGVIDNTQSYGLQAPRLSRADLSAIPETNYGIDQKGAMIYITDISGGVTTGQKINVNAIGYYYFDGSVWVKVTDGNTTNTGASTEPWYQSGTTNQATANNQNIYQSGNIGIRTVNPASALDITGASGTTDGVISIRSFGGAAISNPAGTISFEKSGGTPTAPTAVATGDFLGSLTFSGNDGVGQRTGPSINAVAAGPVSAGSLPIDLAFSMGYPRLWGSEKMRITSNGNVGIGVSTPRRLLEVNDIIGAAGIITAPPQPGMLSTFDTYLINQIYNHSIIVTTALGGSFNLFTDGDASNKFMGGFQTLTAYNNKVGIGIGKIYQMEPGNTLEVLSDAPDTSGVRLSNLPNASFLGTNEYGDIISVTSPTPTPVRATVYGNINTGSKSVASLISTGSSITLPAGIWLVKVGQMIKSTLPGSSVDNMWMNLTLSSENVDGANPSFTLGMGFNGSNNTVSGWLAPAATASGANSFLEGSFSVNIPSNISSATIYPKFSTVEKTTSYSASQSVTTQNSTSNYLYAVPLN